MGMLKWMGSLFTMKPRSQSRGRRKEYKRKERNRVPRRPPQPTGISTQSTSLPEPSRAEESAERTLIPTPTNYVQTHRTATEITTIAKAQRTELQKVLDKRAEVRGLLNQQYAQMQQQQMTQQQADAIRHSLDKEMAMITGMGQDPMQGIANTPYWQQQFGEIGKRLGPFHPYDNIPRPLGRGRKSGK